jgi:hypothetical protein
MAWPFIVPQSGGAITISSIAAGFTQNSNPYQYYLNSGGNSQQSDKFTFTFADGRSFYLTDFSQTGSDLGGAFASSSLRNVVGIPSTADAGYGSTINVIGGTNFLGTYDIYDASNDTKLVDNFKPQIDFSPSGFLQPIANFEYSSGILTVRTPTQSSGAFKLASIGSTGTPFYDSPVTGYRGGAGSATPLSFALTNPSASTVACFYQGTQITLASGENISVDNLNIGDLIHTHKGALPLKWLGRRKVTKSVRQEYPHQLPVIIEKGALGFNMPNTDLMVSQGHTILVEGHLICACLLENDINFYRANCDDLPEDFENFHLEFAEEEVLLLSNGTPTASYVNTQSRMMFDNYQEYIDLYGDLNAEIKPLEYKHRRTACFLDPYKAVVRRSFQEPASLCSPN